MNEVLLDLDRDVRCKDNYLLVKLSGLLHSDDRLALLDIAMQLDVDSEALEGAKVCPVGSINNNNNVNNWLFTEL